MTYTIIDRDIGFLAPITAWQDRVRELEARLALEPDDEGVADALDYAREVITQKMLVRTQKRAAA